MKDNKKRLFEVMEFINPDAKINEDYDVDDLAGDVRNIKNVKTPALKTAQSRIHTQQEFNDAFTVWFNDLGVSTDEYKNRINITTSIRHITEVMKKKGIKF